MRKRRATAVPLAVAAVMLHGSIAVAWAPAEGDRVFDGDNVAQKYHYAANVSQWLKTAFGDAAADFTAVGNDTRAPTFSHLAGAGFTVFYQSNGATDNTEHCPSYWWKACIEFDDPWAIGYIVFNNEEPDVGGIGAWQWCGRVGASSDCYYARRTALHELGHAAGLYWDHDDGHYGDKPPSSVSVMGAHKTCTSRPTRGRTHQDG